MAALCAGLRGRIDSGSVPALPNGLLRGPGAEHGARQGGVRTVLEPRLELRQGLCQRLLAVDPSRGAIHLMARHSDEDLARRAASDRVGHSRPGSLWTRPRPVRRAGGWRFYACAHATTESLRLPAAGPGSRDATITRAVVIDPRGVLCTRRRGSLARARSTQH